jgi:hypothetical protein
MISQEQYNAIKKGDQLYWSGGAGLGIGVIKARCVNTVLRGGKRYECYWMLDETDQINEPIFLDLKSLHYKQSDAEDDFNNQ